ncbi:ferrous iron transport protein B [Chloroflexota bacterium]
MSDGCHQSAKVKDTVNTKRVLLVGNPNVGKSVIFHLLTGKYAIVSNYPGTTVDITSGKANFDSKTTIVDSPGVNSLIPNSEDERVARDLLLKDIETTIIQVADAKNLNRGLVLTTQLAESGVPMILTLNMTDEAAQKGIHIDTKKLSAKLGIPIVSTVAVKAQGINQLKRQLHAACPPVLDIQYEEKIERAISRVESLLPTLPIAPRAISIMLLCGNKALYESLSKKIEPDNMRSISLIVTELQSQYARPMAYVIGHHRSRVIKKVVAEVISIKSTSVRSLPEIFGKWSTHPLAGIPILLVILLLLYLIVGVLGAGIVVDFVESVLFGRFINPAATWLFSHIPVSWIQEMMVGQYGLVTVGLTYAIAIILPVVGFFFLCFSILEDIGYLPRLAVMANSILKRIGLSGRAVLPLVLGLGCDTMATLTTRILESKRERTIATLLLALGIPCSAQVAIILAILSGVSPWATIIFLFIITSQLFLVGYLASKIIPGKSSDFIMEMPPIRRPQFSNVIVKTLSRMEWYFKEAVPFFLLGTLVLFILDKVGFLAVLERAGTPVVHQWLGLPPEATGAFIFGFLRRDYGAAGFLSLKNQGLLDVSQILISLVVITLFIPCIANLFVIIKERGWKTALAIVLFVFPFAILVGGILNLILKATGVVF